MGKTRLEAFSDGVIAIIITIMVLELKAPHEETWGALRPLGPAILSYVLSFVYVGIYWNNHHHLLHAVKRVSGMALWANLHLLFWLSLIPFVTSWMGESHFGTWPVTAYGGLLFMCGVSWQLLARALKRCNGPGSVLHTALGRGVKEWVSVSVYLAGMAVAASGHWLGSEENGGSRWTGLAGCALYAFVAVVWFIPDRRLEGALTSGHAGAN